MEKVIFSIIYFLLPTYFSNMFSVLSAKIKIWDTPILNNVKLRNKPLLGKNKTWRGLVFGTVFGFIVYLIQRELFLNGHFTQFTIHDYSSIFLGLLLSFGAILGDLIESSVKRQLGIKPGERFLPWDQIDHVLCAMILALFFIDISGRFILAAVIITFILHVLMNFVAYKLKVRKTLW